MWASIEAGCGGGRAVEVEVGEAGPQGRPVGVAGEVHEAAEGHAGDVGGLVVGVGAVLSEGGDRCHDEARVEGGQAGIAKADVVEVAGVEGLDEEIGGREQPFEQGAAIRVFEVEGDAALVGAVGPPVEAVLRAWVIAVEGADLTGRATARGLHLYDVSAEVAQDFAAEDAALVGEVEHAVGAEQGLAWGKGHRTPRAKVGGDILFAGAVSSRRRFMEVTGGSWLGPPGLARRDVTLRLEGLDVKCDTGPRA